jgi:hypothetical protein
LNRDGMVRKASADGGRIGDGIIRWSRRPSSMVSRSP